MIIIDRQDRRLRVCPNRCGTLGPEYTTCPQCGAPVTVQTQVPDAVEVEPPVPITKEDAL